MEKIYADGNSFEKDEIEKVRELVLTYKCSSFLEIGTYRATIPFNIYDLVVERFKGFIDTVDFLPEEPQGGRGYNYPAEALEEGWTKEQLIKIDKDRADFARRNNLIRITFHLSGSDKFFDSCDKKYDIILIDGCHHYNQVQRDLNNAILHLNAVGCIILHDYRQPYYGIRKAFDDFKNARFAKEIYFSFNQLAILKKK